MDKQGQLHFGVRKRLLQDEARPYSKWEHPFTAVIVMILCAVLDFIMFRQLFSSFLYDAVAVQWLSIIGMLIGFDLAPIYLGIAVKKCNQGFKPDQLLVTAFLTAFVLALTGNILLRIVMKDMVLPDLSTYTTSLIGDVAVTETVNERALPYAVFASCLPIVTSMVSFGISYVTANPLKKISEKLNTEQNILEDAIQQISATLKEYEEDGDYLEKLLDDDREQFRETCSFVQERMAYYCDYVRERIKEFLGNPASTNILSKDVKGIVSKLYERMEIYKDTSEQLLQKINFEIEKRNGGYAA